MLNKFTKTLKNTIVATIVSVLSLAIGIVLVPVYKVFGTVIITLAAIATLYFAYALIKYAKENKPKKRRKTVKKTKRVIDWRDYAIAFIVFGIVLIIILLLCRGCGEVPENIDVLNVGTLNVQTENVEKQEVVDQNVGNSNVTNQTVVNQQVTNQTIGVETEEDASTPEHTCSVAEENEILATCISEGKIEQICSCGQRISSKIIPVTDHTWNSGSVTVEATETTTGSKTYTCTVCGKTKNEVIPKLTHKCTAYDTVTKEATCVAEGKVEYVCSCGKVVASTATPSTGHSWDKGKVTLEATETRTGVKTYTCTACHQTKTETIEKLVHECKICDEIEVEATCTTKGKIKYVCSCGEVLDTKTTPVLGHDYQVVSKKNATSTEDGYVKYRCADCGDTYKDVIPATGEENVSDVRLSANSFVISEGKKVIVTTTGSASDLRLQQSMDQLNMNRINDTQVELTVKTPGAGGTVSVYDVNTGASVEITIEFIYD